MKKWGIIVLIVLVALACGVTAADLWGYISEVVQLGVSYIFDLCKTVVGVLAGELSEVAPEVTEVATEIATEVATTIVAG